MIINYIWIITDLRAGIVNKAKGSGYIEVGDTKVIASVFDPREIPRKNEFR